MRYFDHNASSPLCAAARQAWLEAEERFPGNPSSLHRVGSRAGVALEGAREEIAGLLGCSAGDLIFCSGATEANNSVVSHFARVSSGEAWISAVEHPSVLEAVQDSFAGRYRCIPVDRGGRVDVGWVEDRLRKGQPAFVGVMAVNNETGVVQPWREVQAVCEASGVAFFCDAVQALGKDPSVSGGLPDYMVGCAHKFGGPKGVGFLKAGRGFRGMSRGGGQEEGRRAGTENVSGVLAMAAALRDRMGRVRGAGFVHERVCWRNGFEARLMAALPGVRVVGAGWGNHLGGEGLDGVESGVGFGVTGVGEGGGVLAGIEGAEDLAGGTGCREFGAGAGAGTVAVGSERSGYGGFAGPKGVEASRVWNTSLVILPEVDCRQRWVVKLDRLGVAVSTGSACATGKEQVSHVLTSMGFAEREASRAVRVSSGWEHEAQDWKDLADVFLVAARQLGVL